MELGDSSQSIGGGPPNSKSKEGKKDKKHALDGGGSSEYSGDFED